MIARAHTHDSLIDQIDDQPVRRKAVVVAQNRNAVHLTRQRRFRLVAVTVNNEGGHGRAVIALRHKSAGLKPEMILHTQMRLQQRVPRDGNTIKKRKNRVGGDRSHCWRRSSQQKIIGVNFRDDALRANVHDRLDTGQAAGSPLHDRPNCCHWQLGKDGVVGDVIQSGATEKSTTTLPDRLHDRRFTDRTCVGIRTEHQFDFKRNKLVVGPTFDFLSQDIRVQSLDAIGRTPNTKVAKTSKDVPPWCKALW